MRAEFSRGPDYQPRADLSRFEQRKKYQETIYLIKSGQRTRYLKVKDNLRSYPLYPYLEYTEKIYRISRQTPESITGFIEQYQDTPLANQLLQNWLYNLAKRGEWKTFLAHYDPENSTEKNTCFYGYALYKDGRKEEAMAQAEKLWLVDFSQPDECDPVFKVWRDNDGLTAETAWQRYALALENNKVTLATYLSRFLAREDRQLGNSYKQVHTRPSNIKRTERFKSKDPRMQDLILHGIKRLARKRPDQALETLIKYAQTHHFEEDKLNETFVYIGKHLAVTRVKENKIDSIPVNLRDHPGLTEARLRYAIREADWPQVLVLINLLPDDLQQETSWQYWKAHVLADSSDAGDRKIAEAIFSYLSGLRTFYGFLSADRLHRDYSFVNEPSGVSTEEILALESTPGIQRALELLTLNERNRARREWYFTTRDFSNKERQIAARVAEKWGWYKPAIQSLIDAKAWNDLDYRFPVAYYDTFITQARIADIPVFWNLAIARQESAFMPDAKSPVGAYGLMQLMPATARIVAKQRGISFRKNRELIEPSLNIKLGSHYLGGMLRRYDNNRLLATAAYNAGPGNVDRWLNPDLSLEAWVETIPFKETRNYVQNVLMFSVIYANRLDQKQPLIYPHEYASFHQQPVEDIRSPVEPEETVTIEAQSPAT